MNARDAAHLTLAICRVNSPNTLFPRLHQVAHNGTQIEARIFILTDLASAKTDELGMSLLGAIEDVNNSRHKRQSQVTHRRSLPA